MKTLVAKAAAGDVVLFMAMVNRIADILAAEGDHDLIDVRRSKAVGILAQPALALELLWKHRADPDTPPEPAHPEPEWSWRHPRQESRDAEPVDPESVPPDPDDRPDHLNHLDHLGDAEAGRPVPAQPEPFPDDAEEPDGELAEPAGAEDEHRSVIVQRAGIDPDRLRPRVIVYVHLSEAALRGGAGVARVEGCGPITLAQVRRFFGSGCQISIQPVLNLSGVQPVDGYEVPAGMREALQLRTPADVFPDGVNLTRRQDADHTIPYVPTGSGGAPGQTGLHNLGPLSRHHHRVKTFTGWQVCQPEPGSYLWRSPHGWLYLLTADGTHPLGKNPFTEAIWRMTSQENARAPGDEAA